MQSELGNERPSNIQIIILYKFLEHSDGYRRAYIRELLITHLLIRLFGFFLSTRELLKRLCEFFLILPRSILMEIVPIWQKERESRPVEGSCCPGLLTIRSSH